jgi:sugar transferase (PEP-CTERM system associated)
MAKGLMQRATWRSATLVILESGLIVGTVAGIATAVGSSTGSLGTGSDTMLRSLLIAYACQLCLYYGDLYDQPGISADYRELLARVLQALGAAALILAVIYFWFPQFSFSTTVFPAAALVVALLVTGWRVAFSWFSKRVGPHELLLVVGTSITGQSLVGELSEREELGVKIIGFVDVETTPGGRSPSGVQVLGTIDDIPEIVRTHGVGRVVVSLADARGKLPMDKLLDVKLEGVTFDHLTSVYEEYTGKIAIENLRPSWLIFSSGFRASPVTKTIKRAMDVAIALPGLIISAPIIAVLAVAIKFSSRGPVFYSQDRVGQQGRIFKVHKLRSMRADAESKTGAVWAQKGDSRITPLGRILRQTRLDELPQFWNVLLGNMSLVGPRPERPEFVSMLTQDIRFYGLRHAIKPGITGWAQVRYTYGASVEDAMQKLQYDLFYIKNLSIWLDLFILVETVKTVVLRKGQ